MAMYEAFYHGVTVLQCLSVGAAALPTRDVRRATTACSGVLAADVRAFPATAPFSRLFEQLCDEVLENLAARDRVQTEHLSGILQDEITSTPSEVKRILRLLSDESHVESAGSGGGEDFLFSIRDRCVSLCIKQGSIRKQGFDCYSSLAYDLPNLSTLEESTLPFGP